MKFELPEPLTHHLGLPLSQKKILIQGEYYSNEEEKEGEMGARSRHCTFIFETSDTGDLALEEEPKTPLQEFLKDSVLAGANGGSKALKDFIISHYF